ncbi:MAG: dihydrolipoyl dehydrogenase [Micrococcaceae bacterium]
MATETEFDILILGGGSGGYATALRGAQLGMKVGLIEKDKLGGTCLHRGCIPTKALLHAAEVADETKESAKIGVNATFNGVDMNGLNAYKGDIINKLYRGLQGLVKSRKVTMIEGEGKLVGPDSISVNGTIYRGKNIVLATGSYSRLLPGIQQSGRVITSEQALEMTQLPQSAIVLGGGVIGVEFASVWNSFGVDVTIIEGAPSLVVNEDAAIAKNLEKQFRARGIKFSTGTFFDNVQETPNGVIATLQDGTSYQADIMLVAVGRGPATEGLGYEEQGIPMDRGFVMANKRLHTGVGNIYAVGDIVPGLQLAHRGFQQGIFVAEEIAGLNPLEIDETLIPKVTYCNPEIASVGLTEKQAQEQYGDVDTVEYNLAGNGKSNILGTSGFVKIVSKKDGPVVGIHMIGARMGEQIGEGQMIVSWEAFPQEVANYIHAHPTQNEALGEAFLALAGKPLHAHN